MSLPPDFDECKYCHHNRAEHHENGIKRCSSELRKEDFDRGRVGKFCGCTHFVKIEPTHIIKEYHSPQLLQLRLEKHVVDAATKWFELEVKYKQMREEYPLSEKEQSPPSIIEALGVEAVILIEGDGK